MNDVVDVVKMLLGVGKNAAFFVETPILGGEHGLVILTSRLSQLYS